MKDTHNLSVLAYSNGFALWLFKSDLDEATFKTSLTKEFSQVSYMLSKNDEIVVITSDDKHINVVVTSVDRKNKSVVVALKP